MENTRCFKLQDIRDYLKTFYNLNWEYFQIRESTVARWKTAILEDYRPGYQPFYNLRDEKGKNITACIAVHDSYMRVVIDGVIHPEPTAWQKFIIGRNSKSSFLKENALDVDEIGNLLKRYLFQYYNLRWLGGMVYDRAKKTTRPFAVQDLINDTPVAFVVCGEQGKQVS